MTPTFLYMNEDISDSVEIDSCYYELHSEGREDVAVIGLDDELSLWDTWNPQYGDEVRLKLQNVVDTGALFIAKTGAKKQKYHITASTLPLSSKSKHSKAWQDVRLLQIGKEVAQKHGLAFKHYNVDDRLYSYLLQENESDFKFLNRQCMLEGCAFVVYNKVLSIYSQLAVESGEALQEFDLSESESYEFFNHSSFGACQFYQGSIAGKFALKNRNEEIYYPKLSFSVSTKSEADRYAKNLLYAANKNARTGYFKTSELIEGYAPGSLLKIVNSGVASWNDKVFITKIRHDYIKEQSKVYFRKCLEGY